MLTRNATNSMNPKLEKMLEQMAEELDGIGAPPSKPAWQSPTPRGQVASPTSKPQVFDGELHPEAWDSVVLHPTTKSELLGALHQYTHGTKLFDDWGLGEVIQRGRGVGILMYGPPGCGKTQTAHAIAKYLGRPLNILDVAQIESCVPGQAERKLKEAFAQSLTDKSVLFFDECDDLVGSRNAAQMMEWKTGIINCLLTSIENHTGITVLATNRLDHLDPALNRRLACKIEIPRPTEPVRRLIWKCHLPKKLPLAKQVTPEWLAAAELSGGEIKNVVLAAARSASMSGNKVVTRLHFAQAIIDQVNSRNAFNQKKNYLTA